MDNERIKKNPFSTFFKTIGLAIAFGLVAGIIIFGINYEANKILGNSTDSSTKPGNPNSIKAVTLSTSDYSSNIDSGSINVIDVSAIVDACKPSVVAINGTVTVTNFYQKYESEMAGSGIIIGKNDQELLIVTNAHVVDSVNNLSVQFVNDAKASAVVKGSKSSRDLAVISVSLSDINQETMDSISIATIGDASVVKEGQAAIAIGNALGYGQSVTVGVVSAKGREITAEGTTYTNLIQTDAAINPGNSGGALINARGEVIGINSCKLSDEAVEGIGYAIPISDVMDIIDELKNKEIRYEVEEAERGYLGIVGKDIDSQYSAFYGLPEGIYISRVVKGSAAEEAELKSGDIIVSFDGNNVTQMSALKSKLAYYSAGETVEVEFYRLEDGKYKLYTVDVKLKLNET